MIEIKNVTKIYQGNKIALNNISLSIEKGSLVGFIGRNGAGKSTTFKLLAGVLDGYSGSCTIEGKESCYYDKEKTSYLPEVRGLDGRKQVLEHLTDLIRYKGISKKKAEESVLKWLERFDLKNAKYKRIDSLSKGNQQKLQFIVAIASEPELLILDEPFSGLDPITTDIFWSIIEELKNHGCTILFSSHNLNEKITCCDEFVFVKNGKIIENGPLEEIQKKYNQVLEIKNESVDRRFINEILNKEIIKCEGSKYSISVENDTEAKQIFNKISQKYSEIFCLRKMNLDELFRAINQMEVDEVV